MIKINDKYSFEKIRGGWALHQTKIAKKTGKEYISTTYHATLEQLSELLLKKVEFR